MKQDRVELCLAVVLSALVAIPFLGLSFVPTMDGMHHLLHGVISNHIGEPERGYSQFLEIGAPVTALGFGWLFEPLEQVLGWRRAYMSVLVLIALGWSWSVRFLIHSVVARRTPLGLLGFCFAFSWPFYMGFLPFCVGAILGVTAVGVAAQSAGRSLPRYILITALLLLSALAHVFPAALCGVAALALSVANSPRPRVEFSRVVACGLPAAVIAILTLFAGTETVASAGGVNSYLFSPLITRLLDLGRTSVAGPVWRWAPLCVFASGGVLLALLHRPSRGITAAAATAAAFIVLALLSPLHMTAWEYFSPRPLLFGLALGLAAAAACVPVSHRRAQLAIAFSVAACSVIWGHVHNLRLDQAARPALTGLETDITRDGWRLPIIFDVYGDLDQESVAYAKPLANIGLVYAAAQGGAVPYLFASAPSVHGALFLPNLGGISVPERSYFDAHTDPEWQRPGRLQALRTSLLADGAAYQDVIVWGDAETIGMLEARGFMVDHQDGLLALAHFQGCQLAVSANAPPDAEGVVQWGWFPLEAETGRMTTSDDDGSPGRQVATLTSPCGQTWIRLAVRFGETTYVCEASSPDGKLFVDVTPNLAVHCDLRPYVPPTPPP